VVVGTFKVGEKAKDGVLQDDPETLTPGDIVAGATVPEEKYETLPKEVVVAVPITVSVGVEERD